MTDSTIYTSYVKSTTVADVQQIGVKMATVVHLMAACGSEQSKAVAFVNEVKSELGKAIKLNDFASRMERQLNNVTGNSIQEYAQRIKILDSFKQEAEVLGVDTSSWKGRTEKLDSLASLAINSVSSKRVEPPSIQVMSKDEAQSIVKTIENMANNCKDNVKNTIIKAVDSLGKLDSVMNSTIEALKEF